MQVTKEMLDAFGEQFFGRTKTLLGEQETRYKADLDARDARINEELAALKRGGTVTLPGGARSKTEEAFSFARLMHGITTGRPEKFCPIEFALCEKAAQELAGAGQLTKDMTTLVDSGGGFLIPPQIADQMLVPLLQAEIIAFKAGVQQLTNLVGAPVQIPKITNGTTAYWVGETQAHTPSDVGIGQIELFWHDVFAGTVMSNRLVNFSSPAAEMIVRKQLVRDLGLKVDAAIFNGTGVGGQPTGIIQTIGINDVSSVGDLAADTAYDKLIDMQTAILEDNANVGEMVYALHPTLFGKIRKMKDPTSGAQPKARRLIDEGAPDRLLGLRYVLSTQMPTNVVLLGCFNAAVLGQWGTMVIAASNEAGNNFRNRTTEVLVGMTVDVGVLHPESFCTGSGAS
jgi:HK97 family phage major capsid protein